MDASRPAGGASPSAVDERAAARGEDAILRDVLRSVRRIAVLGLKDGPDEDSWRVSRYLQQHGYTIVPVNPKLAATLGLRAFPTLAAAPPPLDLVDVFRASLHVRGHVDEILALSPRPKCVWLQLGVRDDESARRLESAGIAVVQDRCIMVEHRRLLG